MHSATNLPTLFAPIAAPEAAADLLSQVIQHSPIGIAVIDHVGQFVHVNPAYCRLYGWRSEQMLGQPFTMIVPPEQHARVLQRHRDFLDAGAPLKGAFDVRRADGQRLSILVESVRLPHPDGPARRLVYVVDISERRQVEQALQGSQQFLTAVLDGLGRFKAETVPIAQVGANTAQVQQMLDRVGFK